MESFLMQPFRNTLIHPQVTQLNSTSEESLSWFESLVLEEDYLEARAKRVFKKLDLDGNASLVCAELIALLVESGESEEAAQRATDDIMNVANDGLSDAVDQGKFVEFIVKKVIYQ